MLQYVYDRYGRGHAAILGAAALLGVDEVWLLGGTQAVAASTSCQHTALMPRSSKSA